jgi:hypothetical protein
MSTPQRIHARVRLAVDRATADVLRLEAKKVLMFGHEPFEDLLDYSPEAQYALAMRFQDAIDLISAVGWDPNANTVRADTFTIALSDDLDKQLARAASTWAPPTPTGSTTSTTASPSPPT